MKRRDFLKTAAAAAAFAACGPAWLRRAFGDTSIQPPSSDDTLPPVAETLRRAREMGRPMLVFVVPADAELIYERGHLFGEYLNNADEEQMAPLALAELSCATIAKLREAGVAVKARGAEPLVVVVEPERGAADPWTSAPLPVPTWSDWTRGRGGPSPREDEAVIAERVKLVAQTVRTALVRDAEMVAKRAKAARARAPKDAIAVDDVLRHERPPTAEQVTAIAASIYERAERDPANRGLLVAALASAARARYRVQPPPGSYWASSFGCGTNIEGEAPEMVGCGMGHVPDGSRRFLYLWERTREELQQIEVRKKRIKL